MPSLDYRDINPSSITVADLIDFDTLIARLSERDREIFHRKLAHEVAESDAAKERDHTHETIEEMQDRLDSAEARATDAEKARDELSKRVEGLREDLAQAERDAVNATENLAALRQENARLLARVNASAQEIAAAEQRGYELGYERGRADERAQAAA